MFIRKTLHNKIVEEKEKQIRELKKHAEGKMKLSIENIKVKEANKELRDENEEQGDFIKRIEKLVNSNKYNNEKAVLNKIKELISDYQSQN